MTVEVRVAAGISELNLPGLIAAATRRIILHAALYAPFADSPDFETAFETALFRPGFQRLDAIIFQPEESREWGGMFSEAMRCGVPESDFRAECEASARFIRTLESDYPEKVRVHFLRAFPCLPVVVADDVIVCGQYARSPVHAPEGFWMRIEADVECLSEQARIGFIPDAASSEERAAYRLLCECFKAMNE